MFPRLWFTTVLTFAVASLTGCGVASVAEPAAKKAEGKPAATDDAQAKETSSEKNPPALLSPAELADGWISLFDGQTLFGWKAESEADWAVKEGVVSVTQGKPGLLRTTASFADYVLKVDFRAAKGTNSGVFLRTPPVVTKDDVTTKCYELNIAPPDNPFPTCSLVGRKKAAGDFESADWQTFEVTVDGPRIDVRLNGQAALTYVDEKPTRRGFIGLQLNTGKVEFRNIKLKPLGLKSIFNGKDLSGWKNPPDSKSQFSVNERGELNVQKGRGVLESEATFGDFVLQLECISHAPSLNSGVFFRAIPGEMSNGYESQIHNGYKNGDRNKPADFGTGGIYRRIEARRVVADDLVWFQKTLVVDGPHVAAWVNGYQVTDWTDTRPPADNPRNGLRLAAGTLQIQGHDPTTNLSFRNLRAAEMEK